MTDRHSFPLEPWTITENGYLADEAGRNASIFFLGNGYLGLRGEGG